MNWNALTPCVSDGWNSIMTTYFLKVVGKRLEGSEADSLWLEVPQDLKGAFGYRPGQFLTVERQRPDGKVIRQYSLSSTPDIDNDLRITVKKIEGGAVSPWLVEEVEKGSALEVQIPRGLFFRGFNEPRHVVMLACGSGIAPIYSIARHLLSRNEGHRVTIVFGNRSPDTVILSGEVEALCATFPEHCRLEHVMSRAGDDWNGRRGRIDDAFIRSRFNDWQQASDRPISVFLCGPQSFMGVAEATMAELGIPLSEIHRESFDLVLNDDQEELGIPLAGVEEKDENGICEEIVAVVGGEEYRAVPEADESLLAALIRSGAEVPYSCQEGTCASCISKLTRGAAVVRPSVLQTLRQDDLDDGLTLACLSFPTTKRVRIDFDEL